MNTQSESQEIGLLILAAVLLVSVGILLVVLFLR
jgi:hypothetical protein